MADLLIHEHKKNDAGSYDNVYRKTKAKIVETEDGGTAEQKFSDMASHISSKENPHSVTAEQAGADPAGSATQALNDAKSYTDQKISQIPTPDVSGQIAEHNASPEAHSDIREALNGKETAGAAAAVQSKLDAHTADKNNPHNVTAVQVGADPVGSSAAVQGNLDTHIQNKQNPHEVTADQIGAAKPGYVFYITLLASNWVDNSQTVSDIGFVTSGYAYLINPSDEDFISWNDCIVRGKDVEQAGKMNFICEEQPSSNIVVKIVRMEVSA